MSTQEILLNDERSYVQGAMRRAGQNPTDVEVLDILNRIDDNTGYLDFKVNIQKNLSIV